jgi:hypothetical protein
MLTALVGRLHDIDRPPCVGCLGPARFSVTQFDSLSKDLSRAWWFSLLPAPILLRPLGHFKSRVY